MKTRILLTAGAGLAALALGSCGQKAAPAEGAAANATPSDAQSMRVVRVTNRGLNETFGASGRLVVREEAAVGSELSGYRVRSVLVDEGDWVKQGQAMAVLDDALLQAQLAQAEATLAQQSASAEFKRSQFERAEFLAKEGAFSTEMLEQRRMESVSADAALMASQAAVNEMRVRQSRMTLRAPVAGVVLRRALRPGDISMAGGSTPYFTIARDGLIELDAELPDSQLSMIAEGDQAAVLLPSGESLAGKVRFVSPRVDAATSLGRARIELPYDKALRPGAFAEATFDSNSRDALAVPASAIRYESGGPALMVVGDDNKVTRATVKLGDRVGDYVQLISGPPAGTRVLATGASFTLEGDVIEPVEDGAAPEAN
jgi:HlyD family secretion protein